MPSEFDNYAELVGVPTLIEHHAEQTLAGEFDPVLIKLARSQQPFAWAQVVVSDLSAETIEVDGRVENREVVTIHGPTSSLVTGAMPLPEKTQVMVPKFGDSPFHPLTGQCKYGGPMTTMTLVRRPITELDNFHQQRNG